jgi:hypothetical protein
MGFHGFNISRFVFVVRIQCEPAKKENGAARRSAVSAFNGEA